MLPSTDIPIELINFALLAIIALPFVIVACALYLKRKLEAPAWATYWHIREHGALPNKQPESQAPQPSPKGHAPARIGLSAFGR